MFVIGQRMRRSRLSRCVPALISGAATSCWSCYPRTLLRAPGKVRSQLLEAGTDQRLCHEVADRWNCCQSMLEMKVLDECSCRVQLVDMLASRTLSHSSVHRRSSRSLRSNPCCRAIFKMGGRDLVRRCWFAVEGDLNLL